MNALILMGLRVYFTVLAKLAPRMAGRQAQKLFTTPRFRRPVSPVIADVMAQAEAFELDVDEDRVSCYRWPGGSEDAPRVMLVHGWESRASRLAAWVTPLREAGFEVVAFDAPAHGESSGKRSGPFFFARSVRRLVDHVGSIDAVVGHSLGGLSSMVAITSGDWINQQSIAPSRLVIVAGAESGVEAMGLFCDALGLAPSFLPLLLEAAAEEWPGKTMADFDGRHLMPRREIPTLWLHDPADDEAGWSGAEAVAAAAPHVELVAMPGLGHHKIARDPEVIRRGVEFLAAWASS